MRRIQSFYLFDPEVHAQKMIFLSGPRQVGKTTFVKDRLREVNNEELYFNWDDPYVKKEYVNNKHYHSKNDGAYYLKKSQHMKNLSKISTSAHAKLHEQIDAFPSMILHVFEYEGNCSILIMNLSHHLCN